MNRVYTENLGNARDITLLGGRLQLEDGNLTLGEKDLLHDGTSYFYFSSLSSREQFIENIRKDYVENRQSHVFAGANIDYKLKYVPVLKCGDKIVTLNSEDDYFITDSFFEKPHTWHQQWDKMIVPVTKGCLQGSEKNLLPIKLSYKEIHYLVPRLNLSLPQQLQVVLMPFHVATITNGKREYHVAQIALENEYQARDYPEFEDSTFSAMAHVFTIIAVYGACVAFVLHNSEQIVPFIKSYAAWSYEHIFIHNLEETFDSYVPFLYLGAMFGNLINIIQFILLVILMGGFVPAISLVVPAIGATILAFFTIWIRRIYLRIKKEWLFSKITQ